MLGSLVAYVGRFGGYLFFFLKAKTQVLALRPGFWKCILSKKTAFWNPCRKVASGRVFSWGMWELMVGLCWAVWWLMLGDLEAIWFFFKAKTQVLALRPGFWKCILSKKRRFETLAARWLPEGVFHGPCGDYGGLMLGHLGAYVGRFAGYLGFF